MNLQVRAGQLAAAIQSASSTAGDWRPSLEETCVPSPSVDELSMRAKIVTRSPPPSTPLTHWARQGGRLGLLRFSSESDGARLNRRNAISSYRRFAHVGAV